MEIGFLFIPLVVFLALVAPLWIIFHYITKWKQMKRNEVGEGKIAVERSELIKMRDTAKKLETRISSLEKILDADFADWRTK